MAGDTSNAKLWAGADVYVDFDRSGDAPSDVTSEWGENWDLAGLLDPEEGFTEARDEQTNEFYAWGGTLVKKSKSRHKRTIRFVALEENETTFRLINPGSDWGEEDETTGVRTKTVKVPKYEEFSIGFETRDGDEIKRRIVERAEIEEVGEVQDAETSLTVYTITVVLYPEGDETLYTEISGPEDDGSSA